MDIKPIDFWAQNIEEATHEQIMMNTVDCVFHKMEKKDCKGCAHVVNCAKLSSIIQLQHQLSAYKSRDFADHVNADMTAADMIERILVAKSIEGIEKIIRGEEE